MGGTKSMSDEPENDDDDDDDSDSEAPTPAVTGRSDPDDTAD